MKVHPSISMTAESHKTSSTQDHSEGFRSRLMVVGQALTITDGLEEEREDREGAMEVDPENPIPDMDSHQMPPFSDSGGEIERTSDQTTPDDCGGGGGPQAQTTIQTSKF